MVVYYINKSSDNLADYPYPIKEGDICMLYDGEFVKTIYIDSETDSSSIWRDFKFVDSKSLKSYKLPTSSNILCAPIGNSQAIGDTILLTRLIQECKGEWLLDFLNETSSVLSGFVNYWDLEILRRLTGDDEIKLDYADEEILSKYIVKDKKKVVYENDNDDTDTDTDTDIIDVVDNDFIRKNYDIRWFCITALASIEDKLEKRSYKILYNVLKGVSRKEIASEFGLSQERIRQITYKVTKQAHNIFIEQRKILEKEQENNAKLNVQLNLLREEIFRLKALLPKEKLYQQKDGVEELDAELAFFLDTPIENTYLSVRAIKTLQYMEIKKFVDVPQIESETEVLKMRNSGRKTLHDISSMLKDFHLTFGMSYTEIVNTLNENYWYRARSKWIKDYKKNQETAIVPLVRTGEDNKNDLERSKLEDATIVLTEDIIESARTPNGGFTKSQLAAIGIDWPPSRDWIEKKVGTMITPAQLEKFQSIKYVKELSPKTSDMGKKITYKDVSFSPKDKRKMEAILHAMENFYSPVTPLVITCTIDTAAWGEDETLNVDAVDSILKRLPEVSYVKWGKYILKSRNK